MDERGKEARKEVTVHQRRTFLHPLTDNHTACALNALITISIVENGTELIDNVCIIGRAIESFWTVCNSTSNPLVSLDDYASERVE